MADQATAPRASVFGWLYVALLALYVFPTTFVGGAMADATDATVLTVGVAAATVIALGVLAWVVIGAVRKLFVRRLAPVQLTVLLTLLTLALALLSFYPATKMIFWLWPPPL